MDARKRSSAARDGATKCIETCANDLKKLKVDDDQALVKRDEQSSGSSKQPNAGAVAEDEGHRRTRDTDSAAVILQNVCFCEKGAARKKGNKKLKAMCHHHAVQTRGDREGGPKNSLNLAVAARQFRKPLKESRLDKVDEKNVKKKRHILRSARLSFLEERNPEKEENKVSKQDVGEDKTLQPAFGSRKSDGQADFAALARRDGLEQHNPIPFSTDFQDGYYIRDASARRGMVPDGSETASNRASSSMIAACSEAAVDPTASFATPFRDRVDLPEGYAQEAPMDYATCSVIQILCMALLIFAFQFSHSTSRPQSDVQLPAAAMPPPEEQQGGRM